MKYLKTFFLVAFALLSSTASSLGQGWVTRYSCGDDCSPVQIKVGSDGSTYVLGTRWMNGQPDILLLKYSPTGVYVWGTTYGGALEKEDYPTSMELDSNDNLYVTGISDRGDVNHFDTVTMKFNSAGATQWVRVYSGTGNDFDNPIGIKVDSNGNSYIAGTTWRIDDDIFAIKYDTNGNTLWTKFFDPNQDTDGAESIALDSNNNLIIVGETYTSNANNYDFVVLKLQSATGAQAWVHYYNGTASGDDEAIGVAVDGSDNIAVSGYSYNGHDQDYLTAKYDSTGNLLWAKRFDNLKVDMPVAIATSADGSVYVTGRSQGPYTGTDWATLRYDSGGTLQYVRRTGNRGYDFPVVLTTDAANNVYVAGYVTGAAGSPRVDKDGYTAQYDPAGNVLFYARYNPATDPNSSVEGMTVANGHIYVTLQTHDGTRNTIVTIKY